MVKFSVFITAFFSLTCILTSLLLFWQDVLDQRCWFFQEDESTLFRVLSIVHFAHGQFVAIACHDGEFLAREIEIDAVHDGADGIFCRCK